MAAGLILLISAVEVKAQHNIIYRDHHLHQIFTNPATAGSEFFPVAALSYQKQWLGINQSPGTLLASTSLRMGNFDFYNPKMFINTTGMKTKERVGLGIGLYSDRNGPIASRGLNLAYAYHLILDKSRLSFGLSGSAEQSVLDGSVWDPITSGDPLLGDGKESFFNFNANFGVYYYSATYYAGIAANHLIPLEDKINPGETVKQDYIVHGGYLFRRMEDIKIEPSIHLRYLDYESLEYDIRAKVYLQHVHWLALTYRSYKALALTAGMKIGRFYLAYNFEANLSPIISYSAGTHGIHMGMNLGMRRLEEF
jgi:type IX secretion system PorP/SprF family membrane protein